MAEVAGLAVGVVGIVPILFKTIHAYDELRETLYIIRHSDKTLAILKMKLKTQETIFLNECEALLRAVLQDDRKAREMVEDPTNKRMQWSASNLEQRAYKCLDRNYETCYNIIAESEKLLKEINGGLESFKTTAKAKNESLKTTLHRLKLSVKKGQFEESIRQLRQSNMSLASIVTHISKPPIQTVDILQQRSILGAPLKKPSYSAIQQASRTLYEAISAAWGCSKADHSDHYAKLSIDAKAAESIDLGLAIGHTESNCKGLSPRQPTQFSVQSINLRKSTTIQIGHDASANLLNDQLETLLLTPIVPTSPMCPSLTPVSTSSVKTSLSSSVSSSTILKACSSSGRSARCQELCLLLKQDAIAFQNTSLTDFVGYLDSPDTFKHLFYELEWTQHDNIVIHSDIETASISDLLSSCPNRRLDPVQKLKLARKMAITTLQYQATPWLRPNWQLEDVSFFGKHQDVSEELLDTLHLSAKFPKCDIPHSQSSCSNGQTDGTVTVEREFETERLHFGVPNMPLYSLGKAFLEIGHWESLERFREPRDVHDVITARRLAEAGRKPLGAKFQAIIKKCLSCNFGTEPDLHSQELQHAVHEHVICQLGRMIAMLEDGVV